MQLRSLRRIRDCRETVGGPEVAPSGAAVAGGEGAVGACSVSAPLHRRESIHRARIGRRRKKQRLPGGSLLRVGAVDGLESVARCRLCPAGGRLRRLDCRGTGHDDEICGPRRGGGTFSGGRGIERDRKAGIYGYGPKWWQTTFRGCWVARRRGVRTRRARPLPGSSRSSPSSRRPFRRAEGLPPFMSPASARLRRSILTAAGGEVACHRVRA